MPTSVSIVVASLIIAASVLFIFRWEIVGGSDPLEVHRLDRWTGDVTACGVNDIEAFLDTRSQGAPAELVCDVE